MELRIEKHIRLSFENSAQIVECYHSLHVDYPRFFKMDGLSKLGFLASEMIFGDGMAFGDGQSRFAPREQIAVICFNRSSSLDTDTQFEATIGGENYFPSPSLFVYTLPNIVTGEIAIRNMFFGETSFYICEAFDAKQIVRTVENAFFDNATTAVLAAWIEHFGERREVLMALVGRGKGGTEFTEQQLNTLYNA